MASEIPASDEPRLGLATTRQLLEELKARGLAEIRYAREGSDMAIDAISLLENMPEAVLAYRTVDGD